MNLRHTAALAPLVGLLSDGAAGHSRSQCLVVNAGVNSMLYPLCQGLTSFTIPLKTIPANQPIPLDSIFSANSSSARCLSGDVSMEVGT